MNRAELLDLLYARGVARRYTQDSAVLPDVWIQYLEHMGDQLDLLLTPFQPANGQAVTPGELAKELRNRLERQLARAQQTGTGQTGKPTAAKRSPIVLAQQRAIDSIAYNQASVAVTLSFEQLVQVVLPMSRWWQVRVAKDQHGTVAEKLADEAIREDMARRMSASQNKQPRYAWHDPDNPTLPTDVLCLLQVIGTLARQKTRQATNGQETDGQAEHEPPPSDAKEAEAQLDDIRSIVDAAADLLMDAECYDQQTQVYTVSNNRTANVTLWRSRETVKCDAATRLFELDCCNITWAVLDSGIEARLPAFRMRDPENKLCDLDRNSDWSDRSRVVATYDFTRFRDVVTNNLSAWPPRSRDAIKSKGITRKQVKDKLRDGQLLDWSFWAPIIQMRHDKDYVGPAHPHGTHVAGILAADWKPDEKDDDFGPPPEGKLTGMCPTIRLYDLRVLDEYGEGNEFSIMAALQFIQYVNSHKGIMVVHGANLSLGMYHDKANYACGATPVCDECTRAVGSGLVLVAAAGNDGFEAAIGVHPADGFRSINIADPGNANSVITVGSTHRDMPHLYGVSYFSSRGPTGDGRMKPDLLAPGEKIESCMPDGDIQRMDGTSMAAPHVSGAAALLMARNRELIRQPTRIKQLLCDSAMDLGRIREFQGAGLVDCLRALQSV